MVVTLMLIPPLADLDGRRQPAKSLSEQAVMFSRSGHLYFHTPSGTPRYISAYSLKSIPRACLWGCHSTAALLDNVLYV